MFREARIKLTVWYCIIIMLISGLFSVVIYRGVTAELESRFRFIEVGLGARGFTPPHPQEVPPFFEEHLRVTKRRVLIMLLYINGAILVVSTAAGYFLAGKTLKPIEEVLEQQNRFIADASHELRTPLAALKATIEVALRDKKIKKKEALDVLESNLEDVDNLNILTEDLLYLSKYEQDYNDLVFEQVNIAGVIENAYKKINALAKKKDIKVEIIAEDRYLEADKEAIKKLLLILLDNAVKYTPEKGTVLVTAKSDKKQIFIEVKDTGVGIDEENIQHIFERFYRVDQSRTKTQVSGFGLGLSMVKEIVDLHRGSIRVTSILNKGTTFIIEIPIKHS